MVGARIVLRNLIKQWLKIITASYFILQSFSNYNLEIITL